MKTKDFVVLSFHEIFLLRKIQRLNSRSTTANLFAVLFLKTFSITETYCGCNKAKLSGGNSSLIRVISNLGFFIDDMFLRRILREDM